MSWFCVLSLCPGFMFCLCVLVPCSVCVLVPSQTVAGQPAVTDFQSELANRLGVKPLEDSHTPSVTKEDGKKTSKKKKKKRDSKSGKSRSRTSSKMSHTSKRSGGAGECVERWNW